MKFKLNLISIDITELTYSLIPRPEKYLLEIKSNETEKRINSIALTKNRAADLIEKLQQDDIRTCRQLSG